MFYDTEAVILNENKNNVGEIQVDFQPFEKTLQFEEDIEIEVIHRAFCDKSDEITLDGYLSIENNCYKIMHLRKWDNYFECWLYRCEGDSYEEN